MNSRAGLLVVVALLVGSCSQPESEFPSRDWSGSYATQVVESSTDCWGATNPPPMTGFTVQLTHLGSNDTVVKMSELISLAGFFTGDRMDAQTVIAQPISLPDSLTQAALPEDSLEMISYRLTAEFANGGFTGEYIVRSADLNELVDTGQGSRCEYRYSLKGEEPGA